MFTHNKTIPPIHKWLRLCKPILDKNEVAKDIGSRIQICTKQPRNIQAILGGCREPNQLPEVPADAGCFKCDKKCKVSCPMLKEGNSFKSTRTKKVYKMKQKLTCDSDWVIYLITCKRCEGQYVGKSKTSFKKKTFKPQTRSKKQSRGALPSLWGRGGMWIPEHVHSDH